jgi:hypothetical protein
MAPSATEATTTTRGTAPVQTYHLHLDKHKEIDTTQIDRDVELGKTGAPGAKVCDFDALSATGSC